MIRIIVMGIGGVGGYFGGMLARKYENDPNVEIIFIARGEHLQQIQAHGLQVISEAHTFVAKPALATHNTAQAGVADYVLVCTKSYDLESAINLLKPCISRHTILLPLLNGVNGTDKINNMLPDTTTIQGCAYIVSGIKSAGIIENTGNIQKLYFGVNHIPDSRLYTLEKLLKNANIEAFLCNNMNKVVWEKYIFISATATATSFFDSCTGRLVEENEQVILQLIDEVKQIALAKNIAIDNDITTITLNKLKALPYHTTSSMHRDFQNRKPQTELDTLTGYVAQEGKKLNVETPTYNKMYLHLKNKNGC